jgi:hypothetical protein
LCSLTDADLQGDSPAAVALRLAPGSVALSSVGDDDMRLAVPVAVLQLEAGKQFDKRYRAIMTTDHWHLVRAIPLHPPRRGSTRLLPAASRS